MGGGWWTVGLYVVSAPVPVPFLWTLDFGLGFWTWILDLDLGLGFGTGLGLDNNIALDESFHFTGILNSGRMNNLNLAL